VEEAELEKVSVVEEAEVKEGVWLGRIVHKLRHRHIHRHRYRQLTHSYFNVINILLRGGNRLPWTKRLI
jgi:hypothetical protein